MSFLKAGCYHKWHQKTEQQNLEMASVIFLNFLAKMENLSLISSQKYFDKFDLYQ